MRTAALAIAALSSLCGATARAELPPVHVNVGYTATVVTDRSYDFVDADDHLPMFRVGAGYSFKLSPGVLDVDAAWRTGGSSQTVHTAYLSGLWLRGVEVGATFRYPWTRYVHPYGRLSALYDWATLEVSGAALRQTVGGLGGTATVGLQARIPVEAAKQPAALVFDVGAGYALRPSYGFHELRPDPSVKPQPDAVADGGTDLGSLPLSGITWGFSVGVSL